MITKSKDLRVSEHDKLRDGNGKIYMQHFMEEADSGGTGRLFVMATIPPGSSIGPHTHVGDFDAYYVLDGNVEVTDNGVPGTLAPGDFMICKDGDSHSVENKSDKDAKIIMLVIYTRK